MDADQALLQLIAHIADLEEPEALRLTQALSDAGIDAGAIVQACERAMREVGQRYEQEEYYLSGLIMAGEIMREILVALQPRLQTERENQASGRVLLGTVHGDIHDIGKGILKGALGCWGYSVTDLGVNVPPERFVEHVQAQPAPARVIFWQPVLSGDAYLGQFLRLKVAAQALATAAEPGVRADTRALRDRLAAGETLEVAGYALTAALTDGLARARLELDPARIERLVWLEVGRTESGLMPASRKWLEGMPAERTVAEVVEGPACWQTQETTESHALIAATLSRLAEAGC